VPHRRSPSITGTARVPCTCVCLAPAFATPLVSVCRLHISTGSRRSAATPAMPLPTGMD